MLFIFYLLDDSFEFILLHEEIFDFFFFLSNILLELFDFPLLAFDLLVFVAMLSVLLYELVLFGIYLFLELCYLMSNSLVTIVVFVLLLLNLGELLGN